MVSPREDGAELPLYHSKECRTLARRMRRASAGQTPAAGTTISAELRTVADELHNVAGGLHTAADELDRPAHERPAHERPARSPAGQETHPRDPARRGHRRLAMIAAGAGVAVAAITALLVSLTQSPGSHARVVAGAPTGSGTGFALQAGPGCDNASDVSVSPYNSSPAHRWLSGGTPGCLSAYLYTTPTTSADPTDWQNDLDWWFSGVPTRTACTIGIYIPQVSRAAGTAMYFWTTGSQGYSPRTRFTIDQAANRGHWVTMGPFRFPAGRAHVEMTDTRETGSDATLVASTVRLAC